jgi:hypothetical protein
MPKDKDLLPLLHPHCPSRHGPAASSGRAPMWSRAQRAHRPEQRQRRGRVEAVAPLPFMHLPDFGAEPSERTSSGWLTTAKPYFACQNCDSEPNRSGDLRDRTPRRADDNCAIYLDRSMTENAVTFCDDSVDGDRPGPLNDAVGGPNFDWNTFGTPRYYERTGWYVEMRVRSPACSSRRNGRAVAGISISDWLPENS